MKNTVTVGGIQFPGEKIGSMRTQEANNLTWNKETIMHILRHFSKISAGSRHRLNDEFDLTDDYIDKQLLFAGSKFNEGITDIFQAVEGCIASFKENFLFSREEILWVKHPK